MVGQINYLVLQGEGRTEKGDHFHEDCDVQKDHRLPSHFSWNNPASSDANSANWDRFGAIEQPSEMI